MKYPVFVIEGPDCAGKTTLGKKIAQMTNAHYMHSTYRFKGRMGLYHWAQLRKAVRLAETKPVVMDRWWASEIVYGNVYRDGPEPGYDWRELNDWAVRLGFSYTFACPFRWDVFWSWIQKNYHNQDQLYKLDERRLNYIWKLYRDMSLDELWFLPHDGRVQRYDVTNAAWQTRMYPEHVISSWKSWITHIATPEQRAFIKQTTWRDIRPVGLQKDIGIAIAGEPKQFDLFGDEV